jgi:hypothetical protein
MDLHHLIDYVRHCGRALARAHAKAGDAAAISGYLGRGDSFAVALTGFAAAYAAQTEEDFTTLKSAARTGRIPVEDV